MKKIDIKVKKNSVVLNGIGISVNNIPQICKELVDDSDCHVLRVFGNDDGMFFLHMFKTNDDTKYKILMNYKYLGNVSSIDTDCNNGVVTKIRKGDKKSDLTLTIS